MAPPCPPSGEDFTRRRKPWLAKISGCTHKTPSGHASPPPALGRRLRQTWSAVWNVWLFWSIFEEKLEPPPPGLATGSGIVGAPYDRLHCANSVSTEARLPGPRGTWRRNRRGGLRDEDWWPTPGFCCSHAVGAVGHRSDGELDVAHGRPDRWSTSGPKGADVGALDRRGWQPYRSCRGPAWVTPRLPQARVFTWCFANPGADENARLGS